MNHNQPVDPEIAEGSEFLRLLQATILEPCVASTEHFVKHDSIVSEQVKYLGTTLSLLDRLSCCYWGCHKGDHMKEYLVGRACTSISAAWILVRHGHYDAALGIARDVGEIANLLMLFSADVNAFEKWKNSDGRTRMREFKPSMVRQALEKLNAPIPVGKEIYKLLSERATHVTPNTRPELHSKSDHPFAGGYFQEDGVRICVAHIGFALGKIALTATLLLRPAEQRAESIANAASILIDLIDSNKAAQ
jgi:hypothetical protein